MLNPFDLKAIATMKNSLSPARLSLSSLTFISRVFRLSLKDSLKCFGERKGVREKTRKRDKTCDNKYDKSIIFKNKYK